MLALAPQADDTTRPTSTYIRCIPHAAKPYLTYPKVAKWRRTTVTSQKFSLTRRSFILSLAKPCILSHTSHSTPLLLLLPLLPHHDDLFSLLIGQAYI